MTNDCRSAQGEDLGLCLYKIGPNLNLVRQSVNTIK